MERYKFIFKKRIFFIKKYDVQFNHKFLNLSFRAYEELALSAFITVLLESIKHENFI